MARQGIVAAPGDVWNFKQGGTKTVSLRKPGAASPHKTPPAGKVAGGAKGKAKASAKGKKASSSSALAKFTPGKGTAAKKSVPRKVGSKTPKINPGPASAGGTTSVVTMKQYQKVLKAAKKK